jgi:trimethyllysine dioxygenase
MDIISDDLTIKNKKITEDRLQITCKYSSKAKGTVCVNLAYYCLGSDGHESSYSLNWLKNNSYEGKKQQQNEKRRRVLWNKTIVNQLNLPPIVQSQLKNDETMREVYDRLFRYGFVKIEQVPPDRESTLNVANQIFLRTCNTVFGNGLWEIGNNFDHKDTGYTSASLDLHTDTTYFTEAIG